MGPSAKHFQREAERNFPVRVRVAVPPDGLGRQLGLMHAWLDETCGADHWTSAPAGLTGVLNDAVAFYFEDTGFAHAFVNRFCCGYRPVEANRTGAGAAYSRAAIMSAVTKATPPSLE